MKAVVLRQFGGPENLVVKEIPIPQINEDEVLVQVRAASVNPVDIKTRKGKSLADELKKFDPVILGWDISGTITKTGKNITQFREGDDVFGLINFPGHGKAYAEYVAAPASHLASRPPALSHEECAAASLAAMTAWQILRDLVSLKKGDRVLIHAGAGGVGHYAVQMADYLGAIVTATASAANRDFVLSLGASEHIDYESVRFEEAVHDIDFVLDTIGGEYIDRSLKVLRKGGTIVCIPSAGAQGLEEKAAAKGFTGSRFLVKSDGGNQREIADLLEKGIIRSHISCTYPLGRADLAHAQIESGHTRGKIVLIP